MTIRVAVAGAGEVVTAGLETVLSSLPSSAQDERLEFCRLTPASTGDADVVLYDVVAMSDDGGRELWAIIATGTPVIAIGRPLRPDLAARALAHGAAGTVSTEADPADLLAAVRAVAAGEPMPVGIHPAPAPPLGEDEGISPREITVLSGIARGLSNEQIAAELHIGPNTVKSTIRNAYRKIGVTTRAQAVSWCIQNGFDPATTSDETG